MMLGDDFFRLAHDDGTGRPRLHAKALNVGCAAALLAELISTRHIEVDDTGVLIKNRQPPEDSLMHVVLDHLVKEEGRRHSVSTWLTFFSKDAVTQIAERLLRGGHVEMTPVRKLGRQTGLLYIPVDRNEAARPWAVLSQLLRRHEPLAYHELALAGLTVATGLERWLLMDAPLKTFEFLHSQVANLWPPMTCLLRYTHEVIGEAVLAHRHK
ncbi:hypothetical protein HDA40_003730 [Hamadaea flava]|uniref:GPP34 family phosphoprotein n=1 Tax=Hamadaea flava TaxID=1742688 RepID=A0ABV8LI60_9ACTN|nr:GPP34 family phosphoprotein [Hamadaea flava]MCP2325223.1 hypothetical protein [Hamadaea flava]